ncbi:DUF1648 domain-containing protein [Clostridium fungisolvens]|uniref:DUF1648 domain-containing protein n=1 Tax=Clostridium fungisolvens TaxID=1604897 RepID=A0A6V8SLJ6_9CLOT|nr:DUF1648 domain-containing protein [Clostridium fungisolvens]GFP78114.1 hypothetical protein bsdtw1_04308 [Clostridium fungisolvens]
MTESFGNGSNKRPILKIPYSNLERILEIISIASIIVVIGMLTACWDRIPQHIATHFGITGEPDGWGSKNTLLIMPIISIFFYVLLTTLSKFPHVFNYVVDINEINARDQYSNARKLMIFIKTELLAYLSIMQYNSLAVALGNTNNLGIVILPLFILTIFGTVVYFVRKSLNYK